ncbi:hypothetical protein F5X99DRAFT_248961 [Biscogniauxia marginata]|nr:hypothetical protein F5X99DRAFT_248961 [Biscogniauxia marginata]
MFVWPPLDDSRRFHAYVTFSLLAALEDPMSPPSHYVAVGCRWPGNYTRRRHSTIHSYLGVSSLTHKSTCYHACPSQPSASYGLGVLGDPINSESDEISSRLPRFSPRMSRQLTLTKLPSSFPQEVAGSCHIIFLCFYDKRRPSRSMLMRDTALGGPTGVPVPTSPLSRLAHRLRLSYHAVARGGIPVLASHRGLHSQQHGRF